MTNEVHPPTLRVYARLQTIAQTAPGVCSSAGSSDDSGKAAASPSTAAEAIDAAADAADGAAARVGVEGAGGRGRGLALGDGCAVDHEEDIGGASTLRFIGRCFIIEPARGT